MNVAATPTARAPRRRAARAAAVLALASLGGATNTSQSVSIFEQCARADAAGAFAARLASAELICACGSSLATPLFQLVPFAYAELGRVTYSPTGSTVGVNSVARALVDFAGTEALVSASVYNEFPDLRLHPFLASAVVPIVNLPELERAGLSLVLGRDVLPRIFLGDVHRWDDPSILALQEGGAAGLAAALLANRTGDAAEIRVVVRDDGSGTSEIFTRALSSFSPDFAARIGGKATLDWCEDGMEALRCPSTAGGSDNIAPTDTGSAPFYVAGQCVANGAKRNCFGASGECEGVAWELSSGYRTSGAVTCNKTAHGGRAWRYWRGWTNAGVAAAVLAQSGSIGYASLADALAYGVQRASLVNRAGQAVTAGSDSVSFALLELGGQIIEDGSADLNDLSGLYVWPIVGVSYLVLRSGVDQRTLEPRMADAPDMFACDVRARTLDFLEWLLLSPTAIAAGEQLGYTMMPEFIARNVAADMRAQSYCDAAAPRRVRLPPAATPALVYTADESHALATALIAAARALPELGVWEPEIVYGRALPLSRLQPVAGEPEARVGVSVGISTFAQHNGEGAGGAGGAGVGVVAAPLYMSGVVPLYHLTRRAAGAAAPEPAVVAEEHIDVTMSLAQLADVLLGRIATWREIEPSLPATNITIVFHTADSEATRTVTHALSHVNAEFAAAIGERERWLPAHLRALGERVVLASTAADVVAAVANTVSSIGLLAVPSAPAGSAPQYARLSHATGAPPVTFSVASLGACYADVARINHTSVGLGRAFVTYGELHSEVVGCWPLATSYAVVLHETLVGQSRCLPTDARAGTGPSAALRFAEWMLASDAVARGMEEYGVAVAPAAVRAASLARTLAHDCNPRNAGASEPSAQATTTTTVLSQPSETLYTTPVIVVAACLMLLIWCAAAAAHHYRRSFLRLQAALARAPPEDLVIISDPGADLDDEMAMIMARFLEENHYIRLRAVIANLRPEKERARLVRGTLDLLGMQHVNVGIGTDGGSLTHTDLFSPTAPYITPLLSMRMLALEPGRALLYRTLRAAADGSLTLLCISSQKDAALFLRDNAQLCAAKLKHVVVMGGLDVDASKARGVLTPDTAHNNTFDKAASDFFHRRCHELSVPLTIVTRHAAYAAPVLREIYDHLAQSGSPIGWRLRKVQRDSIERLWRRACSPPGSLEREGLPERCDARWFSRTFCGSELATADRAHDDPVWDLVVSFNMYDVIALLACSPALSAQLFEPVLVELPPPRGARGGSAPPGGAADRSARGSRRSTVSSSLLARASVPFKVPQLLVSRPSAGDRASSRASARVSHQEPPKSQSGSPRSPRLASAGSAAVAEPRRAALPAVRLIGRSAEVHGIKSVADLRIFIHRGIARGIGAQSEFSTQEHVLYATVNSPLRVGTVPSLLLLRALTEYNLLSCVAVLAFESPRAGAQPPPLAHARPLFQRAANRRTRERERQQASLSHQSSDFDLSSHLGDGAQPPPPPPPPLAAVREAAESARQSLAADADATSATDGGGQGGGGEGGSGARLSTPVLEMANALGLSAKAPVLTFDEYAGLSAHESAEAELAMLRETYARAPPTGMRLVLPEVPPLIALFSKRHPLLFREKTEVVIFLGALRPPPAGANAADANASGGGAHGAPARDAELRASSSVAGTGASLADEGRASAQEVSNGLGSGLKWARSLRVMGSLRVGESEASGHGSQHGAASDAVDDDGSDGVHGARRDGARELDVSAELPACMGGAGSWHHQAAADVLAQQCKLLGIPMLLLPPALVYGPCALPPSAFEALRHVGGGRTAERAYEHVRGAMDGVWATALAEEAAALARLRRTATTEPTRRSVRSEASAAGTGGVASEPGSRPLSQQPSTMAASARATLSEATAPLTELLDTMRASIASAVQRPGSLVTPNATASTGAGALAPGDSVSALPWTRARFLAMYVDPLVPAPWSSAPGPSASGSPDSRRARSRVYPFAPRPTARPTPAAAESAGTELGSMHELALALDGHESALDGADADQDAPGFVWPYLDRVGTEGAMLLIAASRKMCAHYFEVASAVQVRGTMHVELGLRVATAVGARAPPVEVSPAHARRSTPSPSGKLPRPSGRAPSRAQSGAQSGAESASSGAPSADGYAREMGVFMTRLMLKAATFNSSHYSSSSSSSSLSHSATPRARAETDSDASVGPQTGAGSTAGGGGRSAPLPTTPHRTPAQGRRSSRERAGPSLALGSGASATPSVELLGPLDMPASVDVWRAARQFVWRVEVHDSYCAPTTIRCGGLGDFELSDELPAWLHVNVEVSRRGRASGRLSRTSSWLGLGTIARLRSALGAGKGGAADGESGGEDAESDAPDGLEGSPGSRGLQTVAQSQKLTAANEERENARLEEIMRTAHATLAPGGPRSLRSMRASM
ncbi:hypothetical protein KFE25_002800 [Diacronema lutheri]|uniref:PBP domain-containing protein n=1 Tax=Diacronema lutheri TaxID=2081491 RepID=A0A8J5XJ33_DIALT|nr:hypothetical protein KFE25_002800 [Diacronema lutheri]